MSTQGKLIKRLIQMFLCVCIGCFGVCVVNETFWLELRIYIC